MSKQEDFGSKLKELESITEWFESEEVDLNEALKKFERGMELADTLKKDLQTIENRVDVIKQKFDGIPETSEGSIERLATEKTDNEPTLF